MYCRSSSHGFTYLRKCTGNEHPMCTSYVLVEVKNLNKSHYGKAKKVKILNGKKLIRRKAGINRPSDAMAIHQLLLDPTVAYTTTTTPVN